MVLRGFDSGLKGLLGLDLLVDRACGHLLTGVDEVFHTEIQRLHADISGHRVHVGLQGKEGLRLAGRAHVAARHGVGIDLNGLDVDVRNPVRSGGPTRSAQVDAGLEPAVCAAVEHDADLVGCQGSVVLHPRFHDDGGGVPRVGRHELLKIVHNHAHRPAAVLRQEVAEGNVQGRAFASEVAADVGLVEQDVLHRNTQSVRQLPSKGEGGLVGGPHLHPVVIVYPDQARVRLQVRLVDHRGVVLPLDNHIGLGEPDLRVSLVPSVPDEGVGGLAQRFGQAGVAVQVRVEYRSAILHGLEGVEHRMQLLVLNVDEFQGFVGYILGLGGDGGHRLSDEPHPVLGQGWNVPQAASVENALNVGSRQHGVDSRQDSGLGGVDAGDLGVRIGTPQNLAPQGSRKLDVGGVQGLTRYLLRAINPVYRLADDVVGCH